MASLSTNISGINISVSDNTSKNTTVSWTPPVIPSGATINSCTLTGHAVFAMSKGSVTTQINGITIDDASDFTIDFGTDNTINQVTVTTKGGNKNALGEVVLSNLVYTVSYTESTQYENLSTLAVKENGSWINISRIYKKMSGTWVEQTNTDWSNLFDPNIPYIKRGTPAIPTARLYSNGALVFSNDDRIDNSHGDVVGTYVGWDTDTYTSSARPGWHEYKDNITSVYIDDVDPISTAYWFYECSNLANVYASNFNAKNVTKMTYMFGRCSALTNLDLSSFDTSKVTTVFGMFYLCSSLTALNLSSFNTENVTSMSYMFYGCESLTNLSLNNFNTSNVTTMKSMFDQCSALTNLDLSSFNMAKVTDVGYMFSECSELTTINLGNFDAPSVTDMKYMFYLCSRLTSLDLSNFYTNNVTTMGYMFNGCSDLTFVDLTSFDMSNTTSTVAMFMNCTNKNLMIYVKDDATKTKIEDSSLFPTNATVVVGSPN